MREAERFFEFLVPLEREEVYLLMLSVRGRLAKQLLGVKLADTVLKREVVREYDRAVFLRKVRRLMVLAENSDALFEVKGHPVPPQATAIMCVINPRHVLRAASDLVKEVATRLYEFAASGGGEAPLRELKKLDVRFTACLHRRASRKVFATFDIDAKDRGLLEEVVGAVGWLPHMVLETPRGYHVIVRAEGKQDRAALYRDVVGKMPWPKDLVEFKNDPMEPVPGTTYGGFKVRILEVEGP